MEMTEERAREILGQYGDFSVFESGGFEISESVYFNPALSQGEHCVIWVQGLFTADELEAIAFLMRNKGGEDAD